MGTFTLGKTLLIYRDKIPLEIVVFLARIIPKVIKCLQDILLKVPAYAMVLGETKIPIKKSDLKRPDFNVAPLHSLLYYRTALF